LKFLFNVLQVKRGTCLSDPSL